MSVVNRSGAESVPDVDDKTGGSIHSHVFLLSRSGSQGPSPDQSEGDARGQSINLYDLPPDEQTLRLIHGYFDNTGLLFPYIHRERFIQSYRELSSTHLRHVRKPWLGMLNMILALSINVNYPSELSQQQRTADSKVFYLRAMALCEGHIRSTASLEIGALDLVPCCLSAVLQCSHSHLALFDFSAVSAFGQPLFAGNGELHPDLELPWSRSEGCVPAGLALQACARPVWSTRTRNAPSHMAHLRLA